MKEKILKQNKNVKNMLIGIFSGILFMLISIMFFSFIVFKTGSVDDTLVNFLSLFSCAIGAFFSGYISSRLSKEKGLIIGFLTGFLLFFLNLVIGFVFSRASFTYNTFLKFLIMSMLGSIGGVLGVNKKRGNKIKTRK